MGLALARTIRSRRRLARHHHARWSCCSRPAWRGVSAPRWRPRQSDPRRLPRRRACSRPTSARPSTPTTSTRSSATAARPTRSSTSTTTSSWATTPTCSPRPELADQLGDLAPDGSPGPSTCAQGVTWQDGEAFTAEDVAFTYNYIIDNDLSAFTSYTNDIKRRGRRRRLHGEDAVRKPKANMLRLWIPILPEHIWSKVPGERAGNDYQHKPPIIGTGPFQTVEAKKGEYIKLVKNPDYWGDGSRPSTSSSSVVYQNAGHDDAGPQDRRRSTTPWASPRRQFKSMASEPALTTNAADLRYFDELCMNCYDSDALAGQPGAARSRVPPGDQLGGRQAEDRRPRLRRLRHGGAGPHHPRRPHLLLGARGRAHVRLRSRQGQADARRGRVRGHRRRRHARGRAASPSSCASGRASDDVDSQSTGKLVAGWFREIGLKIDLQTLDSARSPTPSTTTTATTTRPTSTCTSGAGASTWTRTTSSTCSPPARSSGGTTPAGPTPSTTALYEQQAQTIDPAERKPLIDQHGRDLLHGGPVHRDQLRAAARGVQHRSSGRAGPQVPERRSGPWRSSTTTSTPT